MIRNEAYPQTDSWFMLPITLYRGHAGLAMFEFYKITKVEVIGDLPSLLQVHHIDDNSDAARALLETSTASLHVFFSNKRLSAPAIARSPCRIYIGAHRFVEDLLISPVIPAVSNLMHLKADHSFGAACAGITPEMDAASIEVCAEAKITA